MTAKFQLVIGTREPRLGAPRCRRLGRCAAALFTWWRGPDNAVDGPVKFIYFDVQGVAPIAYTVFAMALGIAAGTLFRRVVPAITTTLVVFPAVRIVTALYLRPLFAVSRNVSPLAGTPPLSYSLGADILPGAAGPTTACANGSLSCLAAHGYQNHITYLPASRFWPVQGVEFLPPRTGSSAPGSGILPGCPQIRPGRGGRSRLAYAACGRSGRRSKGLPGDRATAAGPGGRCQERIP